MIASGWMINTDHRGYDSGGPSLKYIGHRHCSDEHVVVSARYTSCRFLIQLECAENMGKVL